MASCGQRAQHPMVREASEEQKHGSEGFHNGVAVQEFKLSYHNMDIWYMIWFWITVTSFQFLNSTPDKIQNKA